MEWLQVLVLILSNLGIVIPMFLWNRSESNADRRDTNALIQAIREDMKDFHARLALQDQEFKMRMANIEERYRGQK